MTRNERIEGVVRAYLTWLDSPDEGSALLRQLREEMRAALALPAPPAATRNERIEALLDRAENDMRSIGIWDRSLTSITTGSVRGLIESLRAALAAAEAPEPVARDAWRGGDSYEASMLRNLLARIHRDGGHYVEEHGLDKAIEDAEARIVGWLSIEDAAPASAEARDA